MGGGINWQIRLASVPGVNICPGSAQVSQIEVFAIISETENISDIKRALYNIPNANGDRYLIRPGCFRN